MPILNPLTDQHVEAINRVLQSVASISDTIAACEECGLDMSQRKEILEAQRQFAATVKRVFMPLSP